MLLVIDTLHRADSQVTFILFIFFAPLLPAAELEASPSISRLMNAAARPVSPVRSSRLCSLDFRNKPEMRSSGFFTVYYGRNDAGVSLDYKIIP